MNRYSTNFRYYRVLCSQENFEFYKIAIWMQFSLYADIRTIFAQLELLAHFAYTSMYTDVVATMYVHISHQRIV